MKFKGYSEDYYLRALFHKIKVKDIMSAPLITVEVNDELSTVEGKFVEHGLYYLPVVESNGTLAGLISHKYLYKTQSPRKILGHEELEYDPSRIVDGDSYYNKEALDSFILRNIMYKNPFTLQPEDDLAAVITNMASRNITCIPIVDSKKKAVGIIVYKDIINYINQILLE